MTLNQIVEGIAESVAVRAADGNNFGVVLIPEGLIEFIPSIGRLIDELNDLLAAHGEDYKMSRRSTSLPISRQRMQQPSRPCLLTWHASCRSTATPTATYRYRLSRQRSSSRIW